MKNKLLKIFPFAFSLGAVISLFFLFGDVSSATVCFPAAGCTGTSAIPKSGQIFIGNSSGTYNANYLTAGTNITITTSSGAITVAGSSGGSVSTSSPITVNNFPYWASVSGGLNGTSTLSFTNGGLLVGTTTNPTNSLLTIASTSDILTVLSNGNVGIGTTNPLDLLQLGNRSGDAVTAIQNNIRIVGQQINQAGIFGSVLFDNGKYGATAQIAALANGLNDRTQLQFKVTPAAGSLTTAMTILETGNVGIGTTAPSYNLDVVNSVDISASNQLKTVARIKLSDSLGGTFWGGQSAGLLFTVVNPQSSTGGDVAAIHGIAEGSTADGALAFHTSQAGTPAERMRITSLGNVGIGTAVPSSTLHVVGVSTLNELKSPSSTITGLFFANASGSGVLTMQGGTVSSTGITFTNASGSGNLNMNGGTVSSSKLTFTNATGSGNLNIGTLTLGTSTLVANSLLTIASTSNILTILSNGNVGIGTSTPVAKLQIGSGSGGLYDYTNGIQFGDDTGARLYHYTTGWIAVNSAFYSSVSIESPKIAFGTLSTVGSTDLVIATKNGYSNPIVFKSVGTAPTESMRIDSTGNVGIGTAVPSSTLHVVGVSTLNEIRSPSSTLGIAYDMQGNKYSTTTGTTAATVTSSVNFAPLSIAVGDDTGFWISPGSTSTVQSVSIAANKATGYGVMFNIAYDANWATTSSSAKHVFSSMPSVYGTTSTTLTPTGSSSIPANSIFRFEPRAATTSLSVAYVTSTFSTTNVVLGPLAASSSVGFFFVGMTAGTCTSAGWGANASMTQMFYTATGKGNPVEYGYYIVNPTSSVATVEVVGCTPGNAVGAVYSGVNPSTIASASSTVNVTAVTTVKGNITTLENNDWLVMYINNNVGANTAGASTTIRVGTNPSIADSGFAYASPGSATTTVTFASGDATAYTFSIAPNLNFALPLGTPIMTMSYTTP